MASTSLRRSSRLVSAACTASTSGLSTTVVRAATVKDESQAIADKPPKRVRKKAGSTTEVKSGTAEAVNGVEESRTKSVKRKKKIEAVEPMPEDFAPRALNEWKIGPHVSSAGGVENSIVNAATIGANAFALFLKSQRKWESSPFSAQSVLSFKERMKAFGYSPDHILPHGSYLVNLGNPDEDKREKSYRCFLDDLKRCEELGLHLYNFHPGSTVGQASTEDSLSLVAACINRAHKETVDVIIVLENMAGSGNVLGSSFAELGSVIRQVEDKSRVGVCLDTCHMFAAGYDIRTKEGWESTMAEFERDVGIQYLRGMHINDSKGDLKSNKDRHENIGLGYLSLTTFAHILTDPRTQNLPLILETPAYDVPGTENGMDVWKKEVEVLNKLSMTEEQRGEQQLKGWADEIADVVKKASAGKDAKGKRKLENTQTGKRKRVKRSKKSMADEDEDDEDYGAGEDE